MDKISIITTFYNAAEFITKAFESVRRQQKDGTFTIEYIIVDDCSPDNTRQIVEEYIKKNNLAETWHIVTPDKNLGCGGARRFGIEHATGDYFMFLDADDYYINGDFIIRAHKEIVTEDADIVEYGLVFNYSDGRRENNNVPRKITITDNPRLAVLSLFRDNIVKFNVWTKIYRRSVIESYRYSDERMFEDVMTVPVWVENAKKIIVMPSLEVNYRAAAASIIRSDWKTTRLGTVKAITSHFEHWKDDPEIIKAMYNRAMIDISSVMDKRSSDDDGFNEMSELNTYMLKYLYPDSWKEKVYNV